MTARPPVPPFTPETAAQKVRMAEDAWNGRDPARVALADTPDSRWRTARPSSPGAPTSRRSSPPSGRANMRYRLIEELWAAADNRIAVRFVYEFHDDAGQWWRAHGNDLGSLGPEVFVPAVEANGILDARAGARAAVIEDDPGLATRAGCSHPTA